MPVAIDHDGSVLVADTYNGAVRRWTPDWGTSGSPSGPDAPHSERVGSPEATLPIAARVDIQRPGDWKSTQAARGGATTTVATDAALGTGDRVELQASDDWKSTQPGAGARPTTDAIRWLTIEPTEPDAASARVNPRDATPLDRAAKRLFDLAFGLAAILLTLPLYPLIILAIWLEDGRPFFFAHHRETLGGREFPCVKFRSMRKDAERIKADLQKANQADGPQFFMENDPRITGPGRWLRRFSIDELPQLANVLKGDMSLVGPRPPLPIEAAAYDLDTTRRLHVRPGMTGLWQVSGRSDLTWDETVRLDLYYVDNWSMLQDLVILTRTVGAVFSSRGAY